MRLEMDLFAIIKLCPNLALQNDSIVDRLRPVHARIVGLHGGCQVGNMFGKFLKAGDGIDGRKDRMGANVTTISRVSPGASGT